MKKNPNQLSDEDLLKLIEDLDEDDTPIEYKFDSSVLAFVQTFKLNPGDDRIVKKQLYNLYRVWNKGLQKLSQYAFTIELSRYLAHDNSYYYVDQDLFDIANFIKEEKAKCKIDKSKSKAWHQHFTAFLTDTELKEGKVFIELEILYFLYLQWRNHARKTALLGRRQFIKVLDLYFDVKAIGLGVHLWVGVNDQIKNLITKKEVERWRKTRDKKTKRFYYPKEEWKKFALYWEEKSK